MKTPELNQVFKNYHALCKFLGEEVKEGTSKQCQLRYWSTFFTVEKQGSGHKLVITEVKQEYQPKLGSMKNSKNYFSAVNLLGELSKHHSGIKVSNTLPTRHKELVIYFSELCQLLGFCKKSFFHLKEGLEGSPFSLSEQRRVYNAGNSLFRDRIKGTLKSLSDNNFIVATKSYVVMTRNSPRLYLASQEEHETIEVLKIEALGELAEELVEEGKLNRFSKLKEPECYSLRVEHRFYEKLDFRLRTKTELDKVYSVHKILFSDESLKNIDAYKLHYHDQLQLLGDINSSLVDTLQKNLEESLHPLLEETVKREEIK